MVNLLNSLLALKTQAVGLGVGSAGKRIRVQVPSTPGHARQCGGPSVI